MRLFSLQSNNGKVRSFFRLIRTNILFDFLITYCIIVLDILRKDLNVNMKYNYSYMANYLKSILPTETKGIINPSPYYLELIDEGLINDFVSSFIENMHVIYDTVVDLSTELDISLKKDLSKDHISLANSFPILHSLKSVLFNIAYYGELSKENTKIILESIEQIRPLVNGQGIHMKEKISKSNLSIVFNILKKSGFTSDFLDLDNDKDILLSSGNIFFEYSEDPKFLLALKMMAQAEKKEAKKGRHNIFLRCDYDVLLLSDINVNKSFEELIKPLSEAQKEYIRKLHSMMISTGMTCKLDVFYLNLRMIYSIGKREVLTISKSIESGYRILIKAKKIDKYLAKISHFPDYLLKKIKKGYGCNKKLFGENCQSGCHGYSFEIIDELETDIHYIEEWILLEYTHSGNKKITQKRETL